MKIHTFHDRLTRTDDPTEIDALIKLAHEKRLKTIRAIGEDPIDWHNAYDLASIKYREIKGWVKYAYS